MSEILDLKIYNFQNNQYNHIVLSVKIGMILKKPSIQTPSLIFINNQMAKVTIMNYKY